MKTKYVLSGLFLVSALHATAALAGPGVQVGSGQGPEGSGTPVNISVDYEADAGGAVVGGQFQRQFGMFNSVTRRTAIRFQRCYCRFANGDDWLNRF